MKKLAGKILFQTMNAIKKTENSLDCHFDKKENLGAYIIILKTVGFALALFMAISFVRQIVS